jgi:hypothetical protein
MMRRVDIERVKHTNAYCEIERVLSVRKDMYLTKEEIYAEMPLDENGVSLVTIGSLENALRSLAHIGSIDVVYVRGVRYFGYKEEKRGN